MKRHSFGVIYEVDEALRTLLRREIRSTDVEVVFDAPTRDWAARRSGPAVNTYLYDVREDLKRRERGLIQEYDDQQRIVARHLPPRWFKLSYLVTAWTQRPEDEHRLLSAVLACFLRHEALPADLMTGALADMELPLGVTVALPPPEDRAFADVWSALGGELKPSLDVVVSVPVLPDQSWVAGPPVTDPIMINMGNALDPAQASATETATRHRPVPAATEVPITLGTNGRPAMSRQRRQRKDET